MFATLIVTDLLNEFMDSVILEKISSQLRISVRHRHVLHFILVGQRAANGDLECMQLE